MHASSACVLLLIVLICTPVYAHWHLIHMVPVRGLLDLGVLWSDVVWHFCARCLHRRQLRPPSKPRTSAEGPFLTRTLAIQIHPTQVRLEQLESS